MKELKVGMYIRTRDENISKIKYINKFIYTDKQRYGKHYIEKASEHIIDLIEAGDYVLVEGEDTFLEVKYIDDCEGMMRELYFTEDGMETGYWNEQIKEVVTKEQFESMKYIVEE